MEGTIVSVTSKSQVKPKNSSINGNLINGLVL